MARSPDDLLAIKLNDQLLIHGQLNIFALGQREHARCVIVAIHFQPVRQRAMARELLRKLQNSQLLAVLADGNLLARAHFIRRNVHLATVHGDVAVAHQLPRLPPRLRETQAVDNVVQAPLQLLQEQFARNASRTRRLLEVVAELALESEIDALRLLLLAQLQAVANDLGLAVFPVLSGSEVALLDGALIAETFRAFEEQLHALTAAQTTDWIGITGQVVLLLDDRFTGLASPFVPDENQLLASSC